MQPRQVSVEHLKQFGRVKLGWLGLWTQELTADMADSVGLPKPRGVIVSKVDDGTPALAAGLQEGDVVLTYAGQTPKDGRALQRLVARSKIGAPVPLTVFRAGKEITLHATPVEWQDEAGTADNKPVVVVRAVGTDPKTLGLQLASIGETDRETYKIAQGVGGVLIASVTPNSAASDRALIPGDVIVKVQNTPVAAPGDVERMLVDARAANHGHALVLIRRRDEQLWMSLPLVAAK